MKILLFGSNGMLGAYFSKYLSQYHEIVNITRKEMDAENITNQQLFDILKIHSTSSVLVINSIGVIPQRNDMNDFRKYIKINTLFPQMLAFNCQKLNYKMIHITTDCVYNGEKGNYDEDDVHTEKNIYGLSKSLGEPDNCCVIRTSIIGQELQNKKSLLEWVISQNGKNINGYTHHYWNGVTCLQLAKIVEYMIQNNIYWTGVRHIYSPTSISKYELIKIIISVYNLNIAINPMETAKIDKTISSKYKNFMIIPDIKQQIIELHQFKL